MDITTPEEVKRILCEKYNLSRFTFIPRRQIMFEAYLKDNPGKKVILCTPHSRLHPSGKGWIDVNIKQIELMQNHYGIFVFRIEGKKDYYVSFKKLSEYLIPEAIIDNYAEHEHWKLFFWPHCVQIQGNQRALSMEPNDIDNIGTWE